MWKRGKINKRAKLTSVCVRGSQCVGHNMRREGGEGSSLSSETSLLWEPTNSWNSLVKVLRLKFFGVWLNVLLWGFSVTISPLGRIIGKAECPTIFLAICLIFDHFSNTTSIDFFGTSCVSCNLAVEDYKQKMIYVLGILFINNYVHNY